jgi:hypothetical protein
MKERCNNKNHISYPDYGGRGIGYCERWALFHLFLEDMGTRSKGYELDRINTEEGYSKANCRWVDKTTNIRNRRNTRKSNINGEVLTLPEIAERYDISFSAVRARWVRGDRGEELIRPRRKHIH